MISIHFVCLCFWSCFAIFFQCRILVLFWTTLLAYCVFIISCVFLVLYHFTLVNENLYLSIYPSICLSIYLSICVWEVTWFQAPWSVELAGKVLAVGQEWVREGLINGPGLSVMSRRMRSGGWKVPIYLSLVSPRLASSVAGSRKKMKRKTIVSGYSSFSAVAGHEYPQLHY